LFLSVLVFLVSPADAAPGGTSNHARGARLNSGVPDRNAAGVQKGHAFRYQGYTVVCDSKGSGTDNGSRDGSDDARPRAYFPVFSETPEEKERTRRAEDRARGKGNQTCWH
jgi:hypothetical protein